MRSELSRWPPAVWLGVAVASLLVIVGVGAEWDVAATLAGTAGVLIGVGIAAYLFRRRDRPRPARRISWLLPSVALFYAVAALTALAGGAALAAALTPLIAGLVLLATTRTRSASGWRRGEEERED